MIQQPTNYLPVQQAAVQQQIQSAQVPAAPMPQVPASEFNAIKINITGATVGAPQAPMGVNLPQPALYPEAPGQKVNYLA